MSTFRSEKGSGDSPAPQGKNPQTTPIEPRSVARKAIRIKRLQVGFGRFRHGSAAETPSGIWPAQQRNGSGFAPTGIPLHEGG
jgi:hypothetical protein